MKNLKLIKDKKENINNKMTTYKSKFREKKDKMNKIECRSQKTNWNKSKDNRQKMKKQPWWRSPLRAILRRSRLQAALTVTTSRGSRSSS